MPRPHTLLPNDVHTALTCHTCAPTVMHVHTSTLMQISHRCPLCQLQTYPLAVHICIFRPYAGITHQHLLLVPHMNTCIPFQYTLESVLTQHTPKCTLCKHPDLTPAHTYLQSPSPVCSCCNSRDHPGHWSCSAHGAISISKRYPYHGSIPGSSTNLAGDSQECFPDTPSPLGYPKGLSSPQSSHPSLHTSDWRQKMSLGAGQLC